MMRFKTNNLKKLPWGVFAAVGTILVVLLTGGIIGGWFIVNAVAGQTSNTATIFSNWWQVLIFVSNIIALPITVGCYYFFFKFMEEKKTLNEAKPTKVPKIFSPSLYGILAGLFAIFFIAFTIGQSMTISNASFINEFLGIEEYKRVQSEDDEVFNEYTSDYLKEDGKFDDKSMRDNSLSVAKEVSVEGAVLLKNEDNALPLKQNSKISFFGIGSTRYRTSGSGSGEVALSLNTTLLETCWANGLSVNPKLANAYKMLRTKYGNNTTEAGTTLDGKDIGDYCYVEHGINEAPWTEINKTSMGDVTDSFSQYGDAAIMIISRNGGEDADTSYYDKECIDGNYLDLAIEEANVLNELMKLKQNGTFKKVVLLINAAQAMQMKNISKYDLDAIVWVGTAGNVSFDQIALILSGNANPSGRLIDTYVYDNYSAPSTVNLGDFTFKTTTGLPATERYTHNDKYIVYQEGIYVGYRYYETRYEDVVLQKGNAGSYDYSKTVAYPFGYGLSYTNFTKSGFKVKEVKDGYEVTVTVKNAGTVSGKEVVQIYLQKPYTEYDIATGIEKASVELVGYAKTKELKAGESEEVTVLVEKESFKSYDAYGYKTYIVEAGDYYLSAGDNAHDALNNILAAKGKTITSGMDYNGNSAFSHNITIKNTDVDTYSESTYTGYEITNRFDDADPTLYAGTKDQFKNFKYLSRNDWTGTYPAAAAVMDCLTQIMVDDFQYAKEVVEDPDAVMPTFGKEGSLKLLDLWGLDYDDPEWDKLLDQLTWSDAVSLVTTGGGTGGAVSVGAPGGPSRDGPCGIRTYNENLTELMCFPSACVMAATYNDELIERLGNAFGMEILHVGYTGIYGPGANIHRTAFSGRNWEYYSEDPFISGKILSSEVQGLQNRGVIVFTKHFLLNDEERNRYGISVWANEQSIREIYLKSFEDGVTEGNMNGVMSSFNRIGATWSGKHSGLLTEVLRNEWGFVGVVQTDAYVGSHMRKALAESVIAGNDFTLGGSNPTALDGYKDNATVANAVRDCCHRILYTQLHSNAMNGLSMNYKIVYEAGWWRVALATGKTVTLVITIVSLALLIVSLIAIWAVKRKKALEADRENDEVKIKYFFDVFPKSAVGITAGILALVILASVLIPVFTNMEKPVKHVCESVCLVCGGCKNTTCEETACKKKCDCKVLCDHACATCGLCLDASSTDDLCKEKCGNALKNTFKFETEDSKVLKYPGSMGNFYSYDKPEYTTETFVGGVNANGGGKLKFIVESDNAGVACLIPSVSKRSTAMPFTNCMLISVNGKFMDSKAVLPPISGDEVDWYTFVDVNLGCIQLEKGRNVIEFTVIGNAFNFNAITIKSDANLVWYEGEHLCDDVCEVCGLCKHELCDNPVCKEKCLCDLAKQEFNVSDGKATVDGGKIENDLLYFSGVNQKVTYSIGSTKSGTATLYLNASVEDGNKKLSSLFNITVNGESVDLGDKDVTDTLDFVRIENVELLSGNNEIVVTAISGDKVLLKGVALSFDGVLYYGGTYNVLKFEGENATLTQTLDSSGGKVPAIMPRDGSSNGSFLRGINEAGLTNPKKGVISFLVKSDAEKEAMLYFGAGVGAATNASSFTVSVNGTEYTSTETWSKGGWYDWSDYYWGNINLVEGDNRIDVRIDGGASINLDYFMLQSAARLEAGTIVVEPDDPDKPTVTYAHEYKCEAESAEYNKATLDGGHRIRENASDTASGGIYLGGFGEVSINAPGEYYLKYTITASEACEVEVFINVAAYSLQSDSFTCKLNGNTVALDNALSADGWKVFSTQSMGTMDLQAGDNEFYIYFTNNALCNIDYFVFATNGELTIE